MTHFSVCCCYLDSSFILRLVSYLQLVLAWYVPLIYLSCFHVGELAEKFFCGLIMFWYPAASSHTLFCGIFGSYARVCLRTSTNDCPVQADRKWSGYWQRTGSQITNSILDDIYCSCFTDGLFPDLYNFVFYSSEATGICLANAAASYVCYTPSGE